MTLASNDSGSLSSSSSRSSSRSAPSSGAVPSSWAIRASVALCSARAAAPSGGIFVSSSQLRSEEARARSEIAPRRRRRSSKRDRRSGTRAETSGLRGQVVGHERETEHDEEDRQQKQDQTADRNERSRARLAALLDVVQVLGFGLELLDRSRSSTERFSVEPSSVLPHLAQLAHHSSLSDLGAVVSSPGWTRTNNPPVNSRMLCQLSYRGIGGGNCSPPSGEGSDLLPESREALLELDQPIAGGFRELALHRALAQAEEELARRLEGDLVLVPQRVQLGEQRRQLVVGLILSEQVRPCPSVQLVVEVLRAEQLQLRQQRLVRRHAREGAAHETRLGVGRQVEEIGREPDRVQPLGRVGERREKAADRGEGALPVTRARVLEPYAMHRVADGRCEPLPEGIGIVRGIGSRRQRHDPDSEPVAHRKLHPTQRRVLAGGVGVEAEEEALRQPGKLAQLRLGERRAHRRNHRREARLAQREDVRVPLDDDRPVLARDRLPCRVQAVEEVALAEQLALPRVDVLGLEWIVVVELPRLEAPHTAARVGEREDDAPLEVVVAAAVGEPDGLQVLRRVALLERARCEPGAARRIAEPELAADLLLEPAGREVLARRRARVRIPEHPRVELCRPLEQGL